MKTLTPDAAGVAQTPGFSLKATQAAAPVFTGRLPSGWTFDVYDRVEALAPGVWEDFFPAHWKDHRYYKTLEETFSGQFPQRYLVLHDAGTGAIQAVQPLFFVEQDLTVSLAASVRALLRHFVAGCGCG